MNKRDVDLADFHSHILPGADHGSDSVDTTLSQLRLGKKYGVSRILATPHFYPHRHLLGDFLSRRQMSVSKLAESYTESMPEIKLGAEVLVCQGLENFKDLDKLCFAGTNTIMLELPHALLSDEYVDTVLAVKKKGFDVLLAHVDRYEQSVIEGFISAGITKFQINASSLVALKKKKHLFEWLKSGYVIALGSDIHGASAKAYKNFMKAKNKLGEELDELKAKSDSLWSMIKKYTLEV